MPASKTDTSKKTVKKKPARKKPVRKKLSTRGKSHARQIIDPELRYRMIAESAYFIAEKDGFSGDNVKYWLAAEQEIDKKYRQ